MIGESKERKTTIELLDYLLDQKVLKKESIEGMAEHFGYIENLLKEYIRYREMEFYSWVEYWSRLNHREHDSSYPRKDYKACEHSSCLAAKKTSLELGLLI